MEDNIKRCPKCGEIKSILDFNKNRSKKDGLSNYCKLCCNSYGKRYSEINKEKSIEYRIKYKDKHKEYYIKNKDKCNEYYRKYSLENKLTLSEKSKIYYEKNREKIIARSKKYYIENKEKLQDYQKQYSKQNKDKILLYFVKYREINKEYLNKKSREYNKVNSENIKKYKVDNSEMILAQRRKYFRDRRKSDPLFKLAGILRSRTKDAFKFSRWNKNNKNSDMLGCDYKTAFNHIESKFTEGMNWDNHGEWHIDHIIPLASAKTEEELIKLCHYTNLQPLWAIDNFKKGCKVLYNQ